MSGLGSLVEKYEHGHPLDKQKSGRNIVGNLDALLHEACYEGADVTLAEIIAYIEKCLVYMKADPESRVTEMSRLGNLVEEYECYHPLDKQSGRNIAGTLDDFLHEAYYEEANRATLAEIIAYMEKCLVYMKADPEARVFPKDRSSFGARH